MDNKHMQFSGVLQFIIQLIYKAHTSLNNFDRVNQALFSPSTNVDSYASGKHVRNVLLPTVSSAERSEEEEPIKNSQDSNQSIIKPFVIMDHQIPNMITLSLLPRSQWQSLTNLDIIKVMYFCLCFNPQNFCCIVINPVTLH